MNACAGKVLCQRLGALAPAGRASLSSARGWTVFVDGTVFCLTPLETVRLLAAARGWAPTLFPPDVTIATGVTSAKPIAAKKVAAPLACRHVNVSRPATLKLNEGPATPPKGLQDEEDERAEGKEGDRAEDAARVRGREP